MSYSLEELEACGKRCYQEGRAAAEELVKDALESFRWISEKADSFAQARAMARKWLVQNQARAAAYLRGERGSGAEVARLQREAFVAGADRARGDWDDIEDDELFDKAAKEAAYHFYSDVPPAPKAGEEGR